MGFTKGDLAKTKLKLIYQINAVTFIVMWPIISTQNVLWVSEKIYESHFQIIRNMILIRGSKKYILKVYLESKRSSRY